ncbi:methyltransferase domain-containing protein [Frigidibacter oleivorans]|uniref:methyltransferase domain-containing protein n=1 Tax=Frigidibacter oleivorans TaxID=2487129 RepID=UPI000F8D8504|nr:methyltransferase domain-containing protein [Frigidibacter oleivorans]
MADAPGRAIADPTPDADDRAGGTGLRPALELLARVGDLPEGGVVDLGCGSGAAGPALAARFPDRALTGIDRSDRMLARAAATGAYRRCLAEGIATWDPATAPALIFSCAALHWLADHDRLFPTLAGHLAPGGTLAVQMPRQAAAPSHRFLREFTLDMFPDRTIAEPAPVLAPIDYHRLLTPLGQLDIWETEYLHRLDPGSAGSGHPVRQFLEPTLLPPYAEALAPGELSALVARYDEALAAAYPVEPDGAVLFPFRRLFLVLTLPGHPF